MGKRVSETRTVLTQESLKELVHYNPETGVFTCLKKNAKRNIGDVLGHTHGTYYLGTSIQYKTYLLHRLAFLYMLGRFPSKFVDHINMDKRDNRWCNLREATKAENSLNTKGHLDSSTSIKGLCFQELPYPRYLARVSVEGKTVNKSVSLTGKVEAEVVAQLITWLKETREELHGEFARHE